MIVVWDTEVSPKALYFKPECPEDDHTLEGMKAAWDTYQKHRKEFKIKQ